MLSFLQRRPAIVPTSILLVWDLMDLLPSELCICPRGIGVKITSWDVVNWLGGRSLVPRPSLPWDSIIGCRSCKEGGLDEGSVALWLRGSWELLFVASRQMRAWYSRWSSTVSKAAQVFLLKLRSFTPSSLVMASKISRVMSWCMRNFANPC